MSFVGLPRMHMLSLSCIVLDISADVCVLKGLGWARASADVWYLMEANCLLFISLVEEVVVVGGAEHGVGAHVVRHAWEVHGLVLLGVVLATSQIADRRCLGLASHVL